jgi:hypothetical protein
LFCQDLTGEGVAEGLVEFAHDPPPPAQPSDDPSDACP